MHVWPINLILHTCTGALWQTSAGLKPTWFPPVLVQHNNVREVVRPAGFHKLSKHHASAVDALRVGDDQLHLLCM